MTKKNLRKEEDNVQTTNLNKESLNQMNQLKKCTQTELLLIDDDLSCKNRIRFKDINIDWDSMGITEEEFNSGRFRTNMDERIYYSEGRLFVFNTILCEDNELVEWTLINSNDSTEFEVWEGFGGGSIGYSGTIFYEYFGLVVESFDVEFISLNQHEKISFNNMIYNSKDKGEFNTTQTNENPNSCLFDRILIEGLLQQLNDDVEYLYENFKENEVREYENQSKLIRQLYQLLK
jgi:hypothetical protein